MCENMDSNKLSQKIYSTNNFSIDNILQEKPCCSSAMINSYLSSDLINHQQELATNTPDNYKNGFLDIQQKDNRKKRPRTSFTANQIKSLESEFEKSKYLSVSKRLQLSKTLGLSETQIKIWFQNRRTKWKRKYTSDLEIIAQQYYQSMGIHSARPIFIGDRLWLFNCGQHNTTTT